MYNVLIVLCDVYACTSMHKEFTRSIRNLHVHVNSKVEMILILWKIIVVKKLDLIMRYQVLLLYFFTS